MVNFSNSMVLYDVTATIFKNFLIVSKSSSHYEYEADDCSSWFNLNCITSMAGVEEITKI